MKTTIPLISKINQFIFIALLVALLGINSVNATTYYARANSNWNINTTWSLTPGGAAVGVGVWPVAGDIVYISEGATARSVTIPANYTAECVSIYMGGASATEATLTLAASTASLNVSGTVIIYGPLGNADRYIYVNAGSAMIGGNLEMNNGQTGVQGNRNCRVFITTGTVTVSGNLVCNNLTNSALNQTYIDMAGGAGIFNLAGSFTIINNIGTLVAGTTSTFNFNGSAAGQIIPVGVSAVVYNNININNTSASGATLSAAVTATNVTGNISVQTGTLNNGGFAITLASTKNFSVANGATFNLTGTSTMAIVSGGGTKTFGTSSTVNYAGTNQAVTAESYGNIIFCDGGTKTLPISTLTIYGNWTNNSAVLNTGTGSVLFQGSTLETIGGTSSTSFFNLTLNNVAGAVLGINATVNNAFNLTSGILSTGSSTFIMSSTDPSAISGASATRYINGNLQLAIAAGANTYLFPIGTSSAYAPVSTDFTAGTEAGSLLAFTTNGDHPEIGTSSFTPTTTVNRHWTLMIVNGLATANYNATLNWVSADQDTEFDYTYAYVQKYTAGAWSFPTMGTVFSSSAQITGVTGFNDFQVGNGCLNPPTAAINGNFNICSGDEVIIRVDLTGTPNWSYTWSDGTNTGTVSPVTESPSFLTFYPSGNKTYTIINVTDNLGCTGIASGSASVVTGPAIVAPALTCCFGSIVEVPIRVNSFSGVGAISLTMNYLTSVLKYDSYIPNPSAFIDFVQADESGSTGTIRISGIAETVFDPLNENDVLITLRFGYKGGSTNLTWNDSGDGTKCEFATGAPNFIPYCDTPKAVYYTDGSVTETSLTADFTADNLLPETNTTVQFTNLSTGNPISYTWGFDRTTFVFMDGTDEHSTNPQVQFTDGGLYTVNLTVTKPNCLVTETKAAYILAGLPGVWSGSTSTDWNTATNWDNHVVPDASINITISAVPAGCFYPHVPGDLCTTTHCNNITVDGSASLTIDGLLTINPGTALNIKGSGTVVAGH